jgi:tRNA(His) guanylyltransferase
MKDQLGDRMKTYYEDRSKQYLSRRTYALIRIDGKAFHTYTKGCERPFDQQLMDDMDATAKYLCENIQGAKFAYVQSDEISILLTDFAKITTDAWYDYNVQKMTSISASLATAKFNELRPGKLAMFDSRVFNLPDPIEVHNYFIWRQQDATRNSISCVAQSMYSHKELNGKNSNQKQEMIFQKGLNWNDLPVTQKRGRVILKEKYMKGDVERSRWSLSEPPVFTQEIDYLLDMIPRK